MKKKRKLPTWLKRPLPCSQTYNNTDQLLKKLGLETICSNANCPNRGECWDRGTATVLILGNICTRNCKFCSVARGRPLPPDPTEPEKLAILAEKMKLKYIVITCVNRDDLADGGAEHFRNCIETVRKRRPETKFEILVGDFKNNQKEALEILKPALPFVFAHNVETVPRLYPVARMGGNYKLSLDLLKMAKDMYGDVQTKSSIMLGLGEKDDEITEVFTDLSFLDANENINLVVDESIETIDGEFSNNDKAYQHNNEYEKSVSEVSVIYSSFVEMINDNDMTSIIEAVFDSAELLVKLSVVELIYSDDIPVVLKSALNALLNGIYFR